MGEVAWCVHKVPVLMLSDYETIVSQLCDRCPAVGGASMEILMVNLAGIFGVFFLKAIFYHSLSDFVCLCVCLCVHLYVCPRVCGFFGL